MTSVSGHLLGHDFEEKYRKWWSCPPSQLFDLPIFKSCQNDSAKNIKRTLEREVMMTLGNSRASLGPKLRDGRVQNFGITRDPNKQIS